ncbi:MAG: DUF3865 domain-containing protein [Thermonemataceae bacterium]
MEQTNYLPQLTKQVTDFLAQHPKAYAPCVEALKALVANEFKALSLATNPITAQVEQLSNGQLAFIIIEYAGFSQQAIHFLLDAMIRTHDWPKLYEEIQENIEEEKGKETEGIPHLEMMRQGYKIDLGLDTDIEDVVYSAVTYAFLKKMRRIFNHNDNAFLAGALLALEGTAIQEFHILDKMVKTYDERKGNGLVNAPNITLTNLYIDGHKDFEIEHEAHLFEAVKPYIQEDNVHKMVRGYLNVAITMNVWWEQLYAESYRKNIYELLAFKDVAWYQVSQTLLKDA